MLIREESHDNNCCECSNHFSQVCISSLSLQWHPRTRKSQCMCAWHFHSWAGFICWRQNPMTVGCQKLISLNVFLPLGMGGRKRRACMSVSVTFCFPLSNSSTQGKEAQPASVSAKDHRQHLSSGCSDRIRTTAKAQDARYGKSETSLFCCRQSPVAL